MRLLSVANSIKGIISQIFAHCSKCDQNSFFNSFAQDSKSEQKNHFIYVLPSVAILAKYHFILNFAKMANMIRIVVFQ